MWIALSIISALALSVRDISIKKGATQGSSLFSSVAMLTLLLPITIGVIAWERNFSFTFNLSLILISAALIDTLAIYFYSKSLRCGGNLSTTAPLLAFIPVFQVGFSYVFLGEVTSIYGVLGVGLSIAFVLYGNSFSVNKIIEDNSSVYMLGVSLCWGSSSLLHKQGASHFGALLWTSYVCLISFMILMSCALMWDRSNIQLKKMPKLWLPAMSHFITLAAFYGAAALGNVAYVSSIRRLSSVFSLIGSIAVFKERPSFKVLIMTAGLTFSAVIITVLG
ncbi:EamA family transporter [Vibrio maritimus]|uniref:EamA family transporter n=1 Tax=Vibrio maritimus TaxID=990268 RepID=UPI001F2FCBA7|nr:EamA family transporter [Vibrio maritimus]